MFDGRINLIYSETDMLNDEYFDGLEEISFEEVLFRFLKKRGYKRVLFYNGVDGLYAYDKESFNRKNKKRKVSSLLGDSDEKEELKLQRSMIESEAINFVDKYIKINSNVAFVFTDIFALLNNLNQEELKELNQLILDWKRLSIENKNKIFFLEPSSAKIDRIKDKLLHFRGIDNLIYTFFENLEANDLRTTKFIYNIQTPYNDEIRDLINYLRLKNSKKVDFLNFDDIIIYLTRKVKEGNYSLKQLHEKLYNIDIDLKNIQEEFNVDTKSGWQKLDELVGFDEVKEKLRSIINAIKKQTKIEMSDSSEIKRVSDYKERWIVTNLNFALMGNPGTGKTTIAKIIADILKEEKILPYGQFIKTSRSDLVAGYVGQTAIKTREAIQKANGGVLFIDEAYALYKGDDNNDFGKEAIDELVAKIYAGETKEIEFSSEDIYFSCIIAGYEKDIKEFFKANEGLERRFKHKIIIRNYNPKELKEIFLRKVGNIKLAKELEEILDEFFENAYNSGYTADKNASFSVNLFDDMNTSRLNSGRDYFIIEDIPKNYNKFLPAKYRKFNISKEIFDELNSLIGLEEIKEEINNLIAHIEYSLAVNEPFSVGHFVFKGNPGTGKTTVARLLGKIFKELGIFEGEFIQAQVSDFIGEAVGQTGPKTREVLKKAQGGILFIDEAYGFVNRSEYGKEAIEVLIQEMENKRGDFCVILAGYDDEIEELFDLNPGLKSRVNHIYHFRDYNEDELLEIFENLLKTNGYKITDEAKEEVYKYFQYVVKNKDKHFGNARFVREFFNRVKSNLIRRWYKDKSADAKLLVKEDIK